MVYGLSSLAISILDISEVDTTMHFIVENTATPIPKSPNIHFCTVV